MVERMEKSPNGESLTKTPSMEESIYGMLGMDGKEGNVKKFSQNSNLMPEI